MVLVTLIANSVLSYLNLRRLDYNTEQVDHTNNVLLQLKTLQTTIIDAETGQRGYLLTGKESYLEPYTEAAASVDDELKSSIGRPQNGISESSKSSSGGSPRSARDCCCCWRS